MIWIPAILTIFSLIVIFILFYLFYRKVTCYQEKLQQEELDRIRELVEPEVLDFTPEGEDLKSLAKDVWRLRQKMNDLAISIEKLVEEKREERNSGTDPDEVKSKSISYREKDNPQQAEKIKHEDQMSEGNTNKESQTLKTIGLSKEDNQLNELEEYLDAAQIYVEKVANFLDRYDVEIKDFTGRSFNEGLNVEVLSYEEDSESDEQIVKETVEPMIKINEKVVASGKVIVSKSEK